MAASLPSGVELAQIAAEVGVSVVVV